MHGLFIVHFTSTFWRPCRCPGSVSYSHKASPQGQMLPLCLAHATPPPAPRLPPLGLSAPSQVVTFQSPQESHTPFSALTAPGYCLCRQPPGARKMKMKREQQEQQLPSPPCDPGGAQSAEGCRRRKPLASVSTDASRKQQSSRRLASTSPPSPRPRTSQERSTL